MEKNVAQMQADLDAQTAWGKWNTAPAANRLYAAKRAAMSPVRRFAGDVMGYVGYAVLFALSAAPFVIPVVKYFVGA